MQEEAERLCSSAIEPEHMLLAIIRLGEENIRRNCYAMHK